MPRSCGGRSGSRVAVGHRRSRRVAPLTRGGCRRTVSASGDGLAVRQVVDGPGTIMDSNVNVDKSAPMREYVGLIWIEDESCIRLRLLARSLDEARSCVIEKYGEGHVISIWNEEDASSARWRDEPPD